MFLSAYQAVRPSLIRHEVFHLAVSERTRAPLSAFGSDPTTTNKGEYLMENNIMQSVQTIQNGALE